MIAFRSFAWSGDRRRRRRRLGGPGKINEKRIVLAGEALDVFGVTKRQLLLSRRMATRAIKPKPAIGNSEWRLVVVCTLRGPTLIPVPTILCALCVLDHDCPTAKQCGS